jgi:hypothetical protein
VDANELPQDSAQAPRGGVGKFGVLGAVLLGAIIGGVIVEYWLVSRGVEVPRAQSGPGASGSGDLAADVAHLKSVLPTQSHTMKDVGDQWVSLWFAAERKNWPLARFFFDQGRQQIRWTLAIRPERQLPPPAGGTVNLRGLFTPMDMSTFAALQLAIEDEDHEAFVAAYKESLGACQSCHAAVQMPYLRPTIPTVPPSTILGLDPAAP